MKLIVAEKASVARNIASALGAQKTGAYWTGTHYIITHCVGHLCGLAMPQDYDPHLQRWKLDTLPILPSEYRFVVTLAGRKQFSLVKNLMEDDRIVSIINACDADREGEHIFRLVYQLAECHKKVERLWISSMEKAAILAGMQKLRPMGDYDDLAEAAKCREIADWLLGINLSRLYSLLYHTQLTVGRVQTPTVNMVVQRELEIQAFVPSDYHIIQADFGAFSASYRCDCSEQTREITGQCSNGEAVVQSIVRKEHTENPPALYNLTGLEQDCNRLFGATSIQTHLSLQQLYEKRLATYPRTDSTYLTKREKAMAHQVLHTLLSSGIVPAVLAVNLPPHLDAVIQEEKVSGHPALMPTMEAFQHLEDVSTLERQILLLLMFRLLEATAPPRCLLHTTVDILIAGYHFTANGTMEENRGWKAVEDEKLRTLGIHRKSIQKPSLPDLIEHARLPPHKICSIRKQTQPPERLTEADLLECMEHCNNNPEEIGTLEAVKACGLGTPATRAGIIENSIWMPQNTRGLLTRGIYTNQLWQDEKHLYPTKKAMTFLSLLPQMLKNPSMTCLWEQQLDQIANGAYDPKQFISSIEQEVRELVETSQQRSCPDGAALFERESNMTKNVICTCPICHSGDIVSSRHRGNGTSKIVYHCTNFNCSMRIGSPIAGRNITEDEIRHLCTDGITGWLDGFRSRSNKLFSSKLRMVVEDGRVSVKFIKPAETAICPCPVCGQGNIFPFRWTKEDGSIIEGWKCDNKACTQQQLYTPKYGHHLTDQEAQTLFTTGSLSISSGRTDKHGHPISSTLRLERDAQNNCTGKILCYRRKEHAE